MDKENVNPIEEQTEVPAEKTELEILKEEKDELYDKYLRTLAEYDNFRNTGKKSLLDGETKDAK
jgi:molecular chaperone GrpE (heat shock protein)